MAGKTQQQDGMSKLQKRAKVSRYKLNAALSAETDPRRRVALAMDFLRSAFAINPDAQVAEQTVLDLIKVADRLYTRKENGK